MKKQPKTSLSVKDMATLVRIYNAVKILDIILCGGEEIHRKCDGVMGTLESVSDIIYNGACEKIKSLGEEASAEQISLILDAYMTPEDKAKRLLGLM